MLPRGMRCRRRQGGIDPWSVVFTSLEGGEALHEDVVGVVPVQHADPYVPRVRPELAPAPGQDLVPPEEARAVLHVLPVAAQPRERCTPWKKSTRGETGEPNGGQSLHVSMPWELRHGSSSTHTYQG